LITISLACWFGEETTIAADRVVFAVITRRGRTVARSASEQIESAAPEPARTRPEEINASKVNVFNECH
jgi:hypothetical protein